MGDKHMNETKSRQKKSGSFFPGSGERKGLSSKWAGSFGFGAGSVSLVTLSARRHWADSVGERSVESQGHQGPRESCTIISQNNYRYL